MKRIPAILAFCLLAATGFGQRDIFLEETSQEAYRALQANDFERAEKLALVVMQGTPPGTRAYVAMRVYGECRFRAGGYDDALKFFKESVRPGSDNRVSAMTTIAGFITGDRGSFGQLGSLSHKGKTARLFRISETALPDMWSVMPSPDKWLAYSWLMLAYLDKGQLSLDAAANAEKGLKGNVALDWIQGVRLFELGKYKEAQKEFEIVAKSEIKEMADRAKLRIKECDEKQKGG